MTKLSLHFCFAIAVCCACGTHSTDLGFESGATEVQFTYRNQGDSPHRLLAVDSGCGGCLVPQGDLPAPASSPGGQGTLTLRVDARTIRADQARSVWASFSDGSRHELVVDIRLAEAVTLEGAPLRWKANHTPTDAPLTLDLHAHDGQALAITDVRVSRPGLSWSIEPREPGLHYQIHFTPEPETQPGLAVIQVHTDHANPRHRIKAAFAEITAESTAAATHPT